MLKYPAAASAEERKKQQRPQEVLLQLQLPHIKHNILPIHLLTLTIVQLSIGADEIRENRTTTET